MNVYHPEQKTHTANRTTGTIKIQCILIFWFLGRTQENKNSELNGNTICCYAISYPIRTHLGNTQCRQTVARYITRHLRIPHLGHGLCQHITVAASSFLSYHLSYRQVVRRNKHTVFRLSLTIYF